MCNASCTTNNEGTTAVLLPVFAMKQVRAYIYLKVHILRRHDRFDLLEHLHKGVALLHHRLQLNHDDGTITIVSTCIAPQSCSSCSS